MIKNAHKKDAVHQILNVFWGVSTCLFLLLLLYFVWKNDQRRSHQNLMTTAHVLGNRLDNFIDDLTQSIYATRIMGKNFDTCDHETIMSMQNIVFNNPRISGIVLSNSKQQILCGTLTDINLPTIPNQGGLVLLGPIETNAKNKSAFVLQQKLGNYYLDILLLKDELIRLLETKSFLVKSVSLYDNAKHRVLIKISRTKNNDWSIKYNQKNNLNIADLIHHSSVELSDFAIILEPNETELNALTARYLFAACLIILLLSCSIYYYLRKLIRQHFSLHRAIQNAIKNGDFFPLYQPIIDRRTHSCVGAEVLLRWHASTTETIMPESFIEYAEQSGLIVPITLELAKTVFHETQSFISSSPNFYLSINLSSVHFVDTTFFDEFRQLCTEFDIPTNQIMLEVTERDLLQNDSGLIQKVRELRQDGYSIAVDDFGTGHASISYLQHFPFNYLKIDKLFIQAIGTGAVTEALNQSIIHMAKHLKLNVIAEGVETYNQLETLEEHGVYLMQGWYFSKAISFDKLLQFFKRGT